MKRSSSDYGPITAYSNMTASTRTWQVHWPIGHTVALALTLIAASLLLTEGLVRFPAVRSLLPPPSVGSESASFEVFIDQADEIQSQYGRVDCIFVGSSLVGKGIDLPTVEETYQAQMGQTIHCAKLVVGGLSVSFIGDLAPFLVQVYHPRLIVYGGNVRDYGGSGNSSQAPYVQEVVATPWYRYRLGKFNLQGWLVDHFSTCRYLLLIRNWMKLPAAPSTWTGLDVSLPLQPEKEAGPIQAYAHLKVTVPALKGIDKLASLKTAETQTVMVQIPVHPSFAFYLEHGQQDFDQILQTAEHEAQAKGMPYWRAENLPLQSPDLWWDRVHLGSQGSIIYSQWLGKRIATGVQRGEIQDLSARLPVNRP